MKASPDILCRFVAGAFVVALASVNVHAQTTQLRPSGDQGSDGSGQEQTPSAPAIFDISDDPDPFGGRYNFLPWNPDIHLWGAAPATEPDRGARTVARALPIFVVVDPVSGAILGYEVGLPGRGSYPGNAMILGPDGLVRIRLRASPPLRR